MGLFKKKKEESALQQDLNDKTKFSPLFMIHFLFDQVPKRPEEKEIQAAVQQKFGDIDVISKGKLSSFAIKKYCAHFKEGNIPPQVLMMDVTPFQQESVNELYRSQLWNVKNGAELLDGCVSQLIISDMMASTMDYKERGEMLMDWMETALSLLPTCKAVWIPTAGKLFTAEEVRHHQIPQKDRWVYFCVNVRFFNIQNSNNMVVDSLGMYAFGLPDVQFHFHDLEPNPVVNHTYNVVSYLYSQNVSIKSGETIDGLDNGKINPELQWRCRYEQSLIQPVRDVLDVCAGPFAAGNRE